MCSGGWSGPATSGEADGRGRNVPERDVCLVVSASSWFEISEDNSAPTREQDEYRLRCRILVRALNRSWRTSSDWLTPLVDFGSSCPRC
jgi:hypothetical protein